MSEQQLLRGTKSQESLVVFCRKSTQVISTAGATFFLLSSGTNCLETIFSLKSWWDIVVLFLNLLFVICCALLVSLFLSFRFKPVLVLNREGVEDHSHLGTSFGTVRIKWEEIALISPTKDRRAPGFQVALTAKGWQTFLARQNRWSRFLIRRTMTKLGDFSQCIVLPKVLLPMTADSLIAQINEHFHPQILEYDIILHQDEL